MDFDENMVFGVNMFFDENIVFGENVDLVKTWFLVIFFW